MSKALLKLQIGPVQDFIAQARSTRDLWSGSYLLSWLVANAIQAIRKVAPNSEMIFPNTDEQPLFNWLEHPKPLNDDEAVRVLTPNLPNCLLIILDDSDPERVAKRAAAEFCAKGPLPDTPNGEVAEWQRICEACLEKLNSCGLALGPEQRARWDFQVAHFWQVTWQTWPITVGDELMTLASQVPLAAAAHGAWATNYQLLSHRLDGRRALRNFAAWQGKPLAHKDHFSGKEEVVADAGWLARARQKRGIGHLFRNNDELGAVNLVKRIWHLAYLSEMHKLNRVRVAFDSVPAVAVAAWRDALRAKVLGGSDLDGAFGSFISSVLGSRDVIDADVADSVGDGNKATFGHFLDRVDASIFHPASWTKWETEAPVELRGPVRNAAKQLANLQKQARLGNASPYYAVLAMDGDHMGKWLSGAMTNGAITQKWHASFSAQLSGFAIHDVRQVVELHHGQLIYAGGDDVLAMLPATRAIGCASELHAKFSAIRPVDQSNHLTASIGLAIGHMKEPLQDMIGAAQHAEKLAKCRPARKVFDRKANKEIDVLATGWNRDALAITLFKRSGETIYWGAKFDSAAFPLWQYFQERYRPKLENPACEPPISSRFPHRLIELLSRYESHRPLDADLVQIAVEEFAWVVRRQASELPETDAVRLAELAGAYLRHLLDFSWSECDDQTGAQVTKKMPRPLSEFYDLFALESFIARQSD